MKYPVGIIPYSNMEPYRQLGEPEFCRFVSLVPRDSIKAIKNSVVLAAAIPVGGLIEVNDLVESVGNFGIAAKKISMSVLFFSKIPFTDFTVHNTVKITTESASSTKLLYILFGYINGFNNVPKFSFSSNAFDGELIIGDRALIKNSGVIKEFRSGLNLKTSWTYLIDLAQLWYSFKKYPFVFARWVVRRDAPKIFKDSINQWLLTFKEREQELVAKAVKVSAPLLGITNIDMESYFKVIRRSLNSNDIHGQKLFMDLLKKHFF